MSLFDAYRKGIDASNASQLAIQNAAKARYAPMTLGAEAASKLAYANLMGPQFMAKFMGNDAILANIPDEKKRQIIGNIINSGSGASYDPKNFKNGGLATPPISKPQNINLPIPFTGGLAGNNQESTEGQTLNRNINFPPSQQINNATSGINPDSEIESAVKAWINSPEARNKMQQDGMFDIPKTDKLLEWYRQSKAPITNNPYQPPETMPAPQGSPPTFSENVANYKGVIKEGEKQGEIRANDIKQLNDASFNTQTSGDTLNSLTKIVSSPEFEQIRQTPLLGHHELSYYSKEGTPAQQNMVGQYYTLTGNLVKNASRDFAGQFRAGEQQLLQGMKPNPGDTVDAARGKLESLSYLNEMMGKRAKLTAQIMNQYHLNKGEALDIADKMIKGDDIRKSIHDKLNPTVTIRNKKTGEIKTIPVSEARKMGIK